MDMDVIAIPLPFQGHINPMLRFCNCLSARGVKVTLLLTHSVAKSMQSSLSDHAAAAFEFISDGTDVGDPPRSFGEYVACMRAAVSNEVAGVLEKKKKSGGGGGAVVYDSFMPWLVEVGRAAGFRVAAFFTQTASVCSIHCYHRRMAAMLRGGRRRAEQEEEEERVLRFPCLPEMDPGDLPSYSYFGEIAEEVAVFAGNQASNMHRADCLLFNTFDALEPEVVKLMATRWKVMTIGPLVPNPSKRLMHGKQDRIDLFKLDNEVYTKWLDNRESKSVVYVSFGSLVVLSKEQMGEIAMGLVDSNKYFMWIVRESEETKLPKDFKSKTSEKGVIVRWCPQVEVLSHHAVACFMTHCGWNSTLEALTLGVPMVGIPQHDDQQTNAKFIEDVWKVGVRIKVSETKIITRHQIRSSIKEATEGVRAEELWRNAAKWKRLAEEATSEGGSSDVNISNFISHMALVEPISN
ncbi:hypothetical protein DM860_005690 [Cuscuta australis]|uniref:Glycosyltransferase n=1 Tax=Cuscuta australis TaxID=267555 RepID=A0A328DS83_9ASTE|nr:hypothetical protein DM860_005690 [Cuscuta australis]